jgi:amidohydrolase
MGGEDFAFYVDEVPGAMIRLGVGRVGPGRRDSGRPGRGGPDPVVDIHQSTFDIDERAIGHGVRVFVHTAVAALTSDVL